jgi:hypothetical protein
VWRAASKRVTSVARPRRGVRKEGGCRPLQREDWQPLQQLIWQVRENIIVTMGAQHANSQALESGHATRRHQQDAHVVAAAGHFAEEWWSVGQRVSKTWLPGKSNRLAKPTRFWSRDGVL